MAEKIDWVTARAACSSICVFKELQQGTTADVAKINAIENGKKSYKLSAAEKGQFSVSDLSGSGDIRSVDFVLVDGTIKVLGVEKPFQAHLTLDNEGDCKL